MLMLVAEIVEVLARAPDLTVTVNAFLTIVSAPSFTFTLTSYLPVLLGVKDTDDFSLYVL